MSGHQPDLRLILYLTLRAVRKVFEPTAWINKIHILSVSRSRVVSMPLQIPRISFIDLTGINSILSPYWITWIFSPGLIPMLFLTASGMTIWNLGETFTTLIFYPLKNIYPFTLARSIGKIKHKLLPKWVTKLLINRQSAGYWPLSDILKQKIKPSIENFERFKICRLLISSAR